MDVTISHLVRLEVPAFEKWKKINQPKDSSNNFSKLELSEQSKILNSMYEIYIDGKRYYDSTEWFVSKTPSLNSFMDMRRITLTKEVDLSHYKNGQHQLAVKIALETKDVNGYKINKINGGFHASIPFIKRAE